MKTKVTTLAALGLALVLCGTRAWAIDPNDANTTEGITVRITPNADYGVTISTLNLQDFTPGGYLDLGALTLGVSTWTVRPATVTIVGSVSKNGANGGQELDLRADMITAGGWVVDPTPATDGAGGVDELSVFVLFSATTMSEAPTGTDFGNATANAGLTDEGWSHAGAPGGAGTRFEKQGAHTTDMDQMSVNAAKHMWLYFRLPPETSTGANQEMTLTLTAGSNL